MIAHEFSFFVDKQMLIHELQYSFIAVKARLHGGIRHAKRRSNCDVVPDYMRPRTTSFGVADFL
jgi:hypothetical protein